MPKMVAYNPKPKVATAALANQQVQTWLRDTAFEFQREMQDYPAFQPWKSRPPRSGPRKDGRRTGMYGRGWTKPPRFSVNSVTVVNDVTYAGWVGGKKSRSSRPYQARHMAARGWKSITDVKDVVAQRTIPKSARIIAI